MGRVETFALGILSLAGSLAAGPKSAFDLALLEAQRNARRPSGHAFEATVGKGFSATYAGRVSACGREVKDPDLRDFEVVLKLSLNGGIEDVLVRPETNVAACLREVLLGGSLPAPETANYWVRVGLKLER